MIQLNILYRFWLAIIIITVGCRNNTEVVSPVEENILTSFTCTDTLGNAINTFVTGTSFYLTFNMINKTGMDQIYFWTGPASEIRILRNDTIIISQYQNVGWPQVVQYDTLKSDSTLTNRWIAPNIVKDSLVKLPPGNYEADVWENARFKNVDIKYPKRIPITILDTIQVISEKPNIYIYPPKLTNISIKLEFPLGGSVIQSIPTYSDSWNITVEPSGRINGEYDYLFYESRNPDAFQYSAGWIVSRDTLASFYSHHLLCAGFSQREKNDFIDYWIPRLTDYPYYVIYPQFNNDIDKVIRLNISESTDAILRLFYVVKGTTVNTEKLITPSTPAFKRSGFVVTEWGVILK
ncbi:MAG: hypothetical protein HY800_07295 [Ignavibacteriales bacterium]|nr:hypothetical protein [Ignavibacteriales bacterium]